MSNLVENPAIPPEKLKVGKKYEIRHNDIRIIGTYIGPHKIQGFSRFSVGNPKNPERIFSNTYTFHDPPPNTAELMTHQMYREGVGNLPASAYTTIGQFTNAARPERLYKAETTGTGTGVSLPRGGRKTRKRKTRKRKTRRQRR
jgi:hypothetical protein